MRPAPTTARFLGPGDPLSARTPARFRSRVLAAFRAPANVAYLASLLRARAPPGPARARVLEGLPPAVRAFRRGGELVSSDPAAQRAPPTLWGEVRRLNRAFYADRLAFLRELEAGLGAEPLHRRMFEADSLRPPGLEGLNAAPPLFILGTTPGGAPIPGVAPEDWAWGPGDPGRTAEEAAAQYWARLRPAGRTMRYEGIPLRQNPGRSRNHSRDIGGTLGAGVREAAAPVRRWDTARARAVARAAAPR